MPTCICQVSELEGKLKDKDGEIEAIKSSRRNNFSSEMKLQLDMEKMLSEKVQLLKDLHDTILERQQFREKWDGARTELAECRDRLKRLEGQRHGQQHGDEVEALYQRARARYDLERQTTTTSKVASTASTDAALPVSHGEVLADAASRGPPPETTEAG